MDFSKCCVVSFANSNGNYVKSLERLHESLRNNFSGTFLGYIGEKSIGAPLHKDVPYSFKIYCFKKALEAGFTKILYVDSSCFAIKNIDSCFEDISTHGFLFQDSGHTANEWLNDFSLDYLGISRQWARDIKLVGNAGLMGLDFEMELPKIFFKKWEDSMLAGCFLGEWTNHNKTESESEECRGARHDMISGAILHLMGVSHLMKAGDKLLSYAGVYDEVPIDIIWKAQGM